MELTAAAGRARSIPVSAELPATRNRRELALIDSDPDPTPALTMPPSADGAVLSTLDGARAERVDGEAVWTRPDGPDLARPRS